MQRTPYPSTGMHKDSRVSMYLILKGRYSGGSNTERPKTESIRKPNLFLFCFRMVNHSKTEHSKTELQNGRFSLDHFINIIFIYLFIKQPSLERPFWIVPFSNGPDIRKRNNSSRFILKYQVLLCKLLWAHSDSCRHLNMARLSNGQVYIAGTHLCNGILAVDNGLHVCYQFRILRNLRLTSS